ncbi:MAG: citramalate synthase [Fibrobacter sp.]|nr:citramalate synthase [Fibrobacter sp.]
MKLEIYDTTLRDGNQAPGINFTLSDKLQTTRLLDSFGVDYIEGGWPNASNPTDLEYFRRVKTLKLQHAQIAAFASTRRPNVKAEDDMFLADLVASEAPVKTIFGKSWDLHVTEVIKTTLEENLAMIETSVEYLKRYSDKVFYDAEHFFDGYLANPEYAMQTLLAAKRGGADCIVLCDTNGGMALTWELEEIVRKVAETCDTPLGIHVHNDSGTAVINSLAAVRAGAVQVQGTMNGYGERCGNANLVTIIPNLVQKMKHDLTCAPNLTGLRTLSLGIDQILNVPSDIRAPYVGKGAFAHKGGSHIDGVMKVSHSFEHIDPKLVGNERIYITSDQAGGALVVEKLSKMKPDIDKRDPIVSEILAVVKEMETQGYHFETAEGTFELLASRKLGIFADRFTVLGYRVIEDKQSNGLPVSEASVKIRVGSDISHHVAEGDGPVNALDAALRKALVPYFEFMAGVRLDDFKVRVLGNKVGTDATVRVWATFGDDEGQWNVAGVSTNIIEASWLALLDGLNYKIMKEMR